MEESWAEPDLPAEDQQVVVHLVEGHLRSLFAQPCEAPVPLLALSRASCTKWRQCSYCNNTSVLADPSRSSTQMASHRKVPFPCRCFFLHRGVSLRCRWK